MKAFVKSYGKTLLFFAAVGLVGGFMVGLYLMDTYPADIVAQIEAQGITNTLLALITAVQSALYGAVLGAIGIVLGKAVANILGDRSGIARFGTAYVPMDEALGFCTLDISGRPYLVYDAPMPQAMCGQYDTCLTVEFMRAFAMNAGITLHLKSMYGDNAHHITEALFKALARALKQAVAETDGGILSAKGVL